MFSELMMSMLLKFHHSIESLPLELHVRAWPSFDSLLERRSNKELCCPRRKLSLSWSSWHRWCLALMLKLFVSMVTLLRKVPYHFEVKESCFLLDKSKATLLTRQLATRACIKSFLPTSFSAWMSCLLWCNASLSFFCRRVENVW